MATLDADARRAKARLNDIDSLADAVIQQRQDFDAYIAKTLNPIFKDFETVKEKLEVLDGSRQRGVIGKSAVRFEDLRYIDKFPSIPPNNRYLGARLQRPTTTPWPPT